MLSAISKKIIKSRLIDKGIRFEDWELDNYMIDDSQFETFNELYDYIVNNWGKFIIG